MQQLKVNAPTYRNARWHILLGLSLLAAGSLLLLVCKLPVWDVFAKVCAFIGGVTVLFGNGQVLFGLMVFSDARQHDEAAVSPEAAPAPDLPPPSPLPPLPGETD